MTDTGFGWEAQRWQLERFILLSVVMTGIGLAAAVETPASFRPYFGSLPPTVVVLVAVGLGVVVWAALLPRGSLRVHVPGGIRRHWALVVLLPIALATGTVLVDVVAVLPPTLNVPFPDSLLFYPTIAFVVEILIHLLPLAAVQLFTGVDFRPVSSLRSGWGLVVAVALIEPVLQLHLGFAPALPTWAVVVILAIVFAVNLTELALFVRVGFVSMLAVRLVYYLIWHVVWGHVRLDVLF